MNLKYSANIVIGLVVLGLGQMALAATVTIYPVNDGFETPDLGSTVNSYTSAIPLNGTTGIGWTFTGSGVIGGNTPFIAANGSAFGVTTASNLNHNPAGGNTTSTAGQTGVLDQGDGTVAGDGFSQSITFPDGTSAATLNFYDQGRSSQAGPNGIVVYVDGNLVTGGGTVAVPLVPATTDALVMGTSAPFSLVSIPLVLGPGAHTIAFAGDDVLGGDRSSYVDNVSLLVTTPEPASVALIGVGSVGLLLRRGRRNVRSRCI